MDGSHIGSEENEAAWRTVAQNLPIESKGRGEGTRIQLPSKIQMKKGETKSIYLTLKNSEELRYTAVMQRMGSVFSENEHVSYISKCTEVTRNDIQFFHFAQHFFPLFSSLMFFFLLSYKYWLEVETHINFLMSFRSACGMGE